MMMYCSVDGILAGDPKLKDKNVELDLNEIVSQATDLVRSDLDGPVDITMLEAMKTLPDVVKNLATLKGKELAYIKHYGARRPEKSEVERYSDNYTNRLRRLIEKVRKGELNSTLCRPEGERGHFRIF